MKRSYIYFIRLIYIKRIFVCIQIYYRKEGIVLADSMFCNSLLQAFFSRTLNYDFILKSGCFFTEGNALVVMCWIIVIYIFYDAICLNALNCHKFSDLSLIEANVKIWAYLKFVMVIITR